MVVSIVIGIVLILIGLIVKFFKPQRNWLFGYRTYLSMKNDVNWNYANDKFANHAMVIGAISLLLGWTNQSNLINNGYVIFCELTLLLISIIVIEISLKRFDRNSSE